VKGDVPWANKKLICISNTPHSRVFRLVNEESCYLIFGLVLVDGSSFPNLQTKLFNCNQENIITDTNGICIIQFMPLIASRSRDLQGLGLAPLKFRCAIQLSSHNNLTSGYSSPFETKWQARSSEAICRNIGFIFGCSFYRHIRQMIPNFLEINTHTIIVVMGENFETGLELGIHLNGIIYYTPTDFIDSSHLLVIATIDFIPNNVECSLYFNRQKASNSFYDFRIVPSTNSNTSTTQIDSSENTSSLNTTFTESEYDIIDDKFDDIVIVQPSSSSTIDQLNVNTTLCEDKLQQPVLNTQTTVLYKDKLQSIMEAGFDNEDLILTLLHQFNGDTFMTIQELFRRQNT